VKVLVVAGDFGRAAKRHAKPPEAKTAERMGRGLNPVVKILQKIWLRCRILVSPNVERMK
jgi:hypothetical protein